MNLTLEEDRPWFDRNPEDLAEKSEVRQALNAVLEQDKLNSKQLSVLDVYLNHWVVMTLVRPFDPQGILELQYLCGLCTSMAENNNECFNYKIRFHTFYKLLSTRYENIYSFEIK